MSRRRRSRATGWWNRLRRDRRTAMVAVAGAIAAMVLIPLAVDWVHALRVERRLEAHLPRIGQHAQARNLPLALVREVVRAESGGDPLAVSKTNARGLMQIMPATHDDLVTRLGMPDGNLFDPDYNLLLGTTYLRHLMDRFDGDVHLVLAAYHMGPTKVARLRKANPKLSSTQLVATFAGPQTRAYVRTVTARLND